ncbi:MAG: type IV pili methyl-accepting chemotaxis transducer N-terminal domain-containing protein [Pseudomonadota bacterium]
MTVRLTNLLAGAALGVSLLAVPTPSIAFETAASVASKINIAGRQRMLTQRMTKAACFASLDVFEQSHRQQLLDAQALFDHSLIDLKRGKDELNLQPETSKRVLYALDKVTKIWQPVQIAIQPVINGATVDKSVVEMFAEVNMPLLKTSNKAVGLMERTYVQDTGDKAENRALNYAGAQRMLSQRIAKDLCFIAAGIDTEASRIDLFASAATFEKRQQQLVEGDAVGKVAAPKPATHQALLEASKAWEVMKPEIEKLKAGGTPTTEDLEKVAKASEELLKLANNAVQVMEGAQPES